jgi:eukaryotic-like serine/threonine-protein kinase
VPAGSVRVPRRFTLRRPPLAAEIGALLRQRLILVATVVAGTTMFFAIYRALTPVQWQFFRSSTSGVSLLLFEAGLCLTAVAVVLLLWRRRAWRLRELRAIEFTLVAYLALYLAWQQLFSWAGSRFPLAGGSTTLDAFLLRQAVDAMAARWMALIVGLSTLIPETPRRNAGLVAVFVVTAMALTAYLGLTDPVYQPHLGAMVALMAFWMTLASTVGIFGSYKLAELRQQVHEAQDLGQYRLIRKIGAGNMGEVHLAEHLLLRQPCAIKLIRADRATDAATLSRFEREVQTTSRLTHWNTVRIYDYGYTEEGTFYYVMEYLAGWTLEELVGRHGPLAPGRAIHLLRQVCAALREAHGIGLVHRDIKPANIITCVSGGIPDVAKLLDFGLVRPAGPPGHDALVTSPGSLTGTPAYMSPEQAAGQPDVDARSDIYAVGAVAYYLVTGQPPFVRDTSMRVLMAHLRESPPPPSLLNPDVPADLEAVILRCLAKDRASRYADVRELDPALAACAASGQWTDRDADDWWRAQPAEGGPAAAAPLNDPRMPREGSGVEWT